MIKHVVGVLLLLVVAFPSPASSQFLDGNDVFEACRDRTGDCPARMIQAFTDMMAYFDDDRTVCASGMGVTTGQIADVFVRYMQENPAERHRPAADLFLRAMRQAFPC